MPKPKKSRSGLKFVLIGALPIALVLPFGMMLGHWLYAGGAIDWGREARQFLVLGPLCWLAASMVRFMALAFRNLTDYERRSADENVEQENGNGATPSA